MQAEPQSAAARSRLARKRLRARGGNEVIFRLPNDVIRMLDDLKERQGLRSRSQALMQMLHHGRVNAERTT